jgi:hypothetical protein
MVAINGVIYLGVFDPGGTAPNHKGRVLALDPINGDLAVVGNYFGNGSGENGRGMPYCIASFLGQLFVGTMGIGGSSQGKVYRILPGIEETWTEDKEVDSPDGWVVTLAVYDGVLYAGLNTGTATPAKVLARTAAGVWSDSFTAGSNSGYCGGLIVFNDLLFVCHHINGSQTTIKSFDGSSWSDDLDVTATYTVDEHAPGSPFVFKDNLYWPFFHSTTANDTTGFLLKRTTGGTWSKALDQVGMRGCLGKFAPDAA